MVFIAVENKCLQRTEYQHMDAGEEAEYPAGCRLDRGFTLLRGKGGFVGCERLADAVFQGAVHQKTQGRDHHQGCDALG